LICIGKLQHGYACYGTMHTKNRRPFGGYLMSRLQLPIYAMFIASAGFQILAVIFLPRTRGFTQPLPTMACCALFICGIWVIARMYQSGAKLGILSPLLAAVIPLGVMAISIFMYHESASPLRIGLLVLACGMIGAAAAVP
jgi:multidrug transporter EmrE-like cation transporter